MSTQIVIPFYNPNLVEEKHTNSQPNHQNYEVVTDKKSWNLSHNPYFEITSPIMGNEVQDEYGFWISMEEYDELCFMDLQIDLDNHFDILCFDESLENYYQWLNFVKEFCPPIHYWKNDGSEKFKHWPSEGRRLLDTLKMQYNIANNIKNNLQEEMENQSSDSDYSAEI